MYGVHIKHLNKSMFTGKMSEQEMLYEHPLELADIKAGIAERPVDSTALQRRQRLYLPIAAVIAILLLGGVYQFVNAEQTALTTIQRQAPTVEIFVPQTLTPAPTQTLTPEPTFTLTLPPPTETALPTSSPTGEQPATDATPSATATAATSGLTWDSTIGAMLQAKCTVCHGAGAMGGLNLSTYADAIKGGASGPAIVPGDETTSLLVTKQQAGGHPGQLTSEELALVIEWIQAGAPEK
jgi:mono/diheme cytochrome c family protein